MLDQFTKMFCIEYLLSPGKNTEEDKYMRVPKGFEL